MKIKSFFDKVKAMFKDEFEYNAEFALPEVITSIELNGKVKDLTEIEAYDSWAILTLLDECRYCTDCITVSNDAIKILKSKMANPKPSVVFSLGVRQYIRKGHVYYLKNRYRKLVKVLAQNGIVLKDARNRITIKRPCDEKIYYDIVFDGEIPIVRRIFKF